MMVQLDLFEEYSEMTEIRMTLKEYRDRQESLRRGIFARLAEQGKLNLQMLKRLDLIEELIKK